MPRVLPVLPQNLVLFILALLSVGTATATSHASTDPAEAAGQDTRPEVIKVTIKEHNPDVLCPYVHNPSAVHLSEDGGATWRKIGGTLEGVSLGPLKRFPNNPNRFQIPVRGKDNKENVICESHNGGGRFFPISRGGQYQMSGLLYDAGARYQRPPRAAQHHLAMRRRVPDCVRSGQAVPSAQSVDAPSASTWSLPPSTARRSGLTKAPPARQQPAVLILEAVQDEGGQQSAHLRRVTEMPI